MATSESAVPVQIAHSGLAEEVVLLEWLVDDGQDVETGSPLVVIESEKTQLEIEAPAYRAPRDPRARIRHRGGGRYDDRPDPSVIVMAFPGSPGAVGDLVDP